MRDFKKILDYYIENIPAHQEGNIKTKKMEFFDSSPADSIRTFDDQQEVAYEGGTFSYLRIHLCFGDEAECKFGSFQRLVDLIPHVKTAEKLHLMFGNIIKAFDGQNKMHGYITKESFVIQYPSFEV
jgi:hypothetical protein